MPWSEEASIGRCEDFPCCGHEAGDCSGQLYGTDEEIKERVRALIESGDDDWMFFEDEPRQW